MGRLTDIRFAAFLIMDGKSLKTIDVVEYRNKKKMVFIFDVSEKDLEASAVNFQNSTILKYLDIWEDLKKLILDYGLIK